LTPTPSHLLKSRLKNHLGKESFPAVDQLDLLSASFVQLTKAMDSSSRYNDSLEVGEFEIKELALVDKFGRVSNLTNSINYSPFSGRDFHPKFLRVCRLSGGFVSQYVDSPLPSTEICNPVLF
jgi:hypothetical protein